MHCCCSSAILFILAVIGLLKLYVKKTLGIYKERWRLEGKTIVVTGANAGIGAECARDFARRGARVIMVCRDMLKGDAVKKDIILETGNNNISLKHIDFASFKNVRECAKEILEEEDHIDVLLNNAGMGFSPKEKTVDGMEKIMQTNHFGPFLFTNLLLGKLKKGAPSRIVNVSSLAHWFAKLDLDDLRQNDVTNQHIVYSNSKLANIYFTNVLAEKLKGTGVSVNSLHPGAVETEIVRDAGFVFKYLVWSMFMKFFLKSSWEGAQTSIYLCVSPSVASVTGKYFSDCKEAATSSAAKDYSKAEKLWAMSEEIVKLEDDEKHY